MLIIKLDLLGIHKYLETFYLTKSILNKYNLKKIFISEKMHGQLIQKNKEQEIPELKQILEDSKNIIIYNMDIHQHTINLVISIGAIQTVLYSALYF